MMKNALDNFLESINKYFHEAIVEAINYVSQDPRFNDEKEKIKKHFCDAMWTYFAGKLGEMPGMEPKKIYDKMMGKLDENINKHHDLFIMIVDNHEAIQRNLLNTHANLDKILNNIRDLINNVEEIKNYQVVANARKTQMMEDIQRQQAKTGDQLDQQHHSIHYHTEFMEQQMPKFEDVVKKLEHVIQHGEIKPMDNHNAQLMMNNINEAISTLTDISTQLPRGQRQPAGEQLSMAAGVFSQEANIKVGRLKFSWKNGNDQVTSENMLNWLTPSSGGA